MGVGLVARVGLGCTGVRRERQRHPGARRGWRARATGMGGAGEEVEERWVTLAHALADVAAPVVQRYFRQRTLAVDAKGDASPVTVADRECERAMRELIRKEAPEHGVYGEEAGLELPSSSGVEYVWVLDPIDGTRSFITGRPVFGTLIALVEARSGEPVVGVISQPILGERWVGVKGRGTTFNGAPCAVRPCGDIGDAYVFATTPHMFEGDAEARWGRVRDAARTPLYGCDCYAYGLLASGHVDVVCEADLKPYDYLAHVPIIEGAGGVVTGWRGEPLRWTPPGDGDVAASLLGTTDRVIASGDAGVHRRALELLA